MVHDLPVHLRPAAIRLDPARRDPGPEPAAPRLDVEPRRSARPKLIAGHGDTEPVVGPHRPRPAPTGAPTRARDVALPGRPVAGRSPAACLAERRGDGRHACRRYDAERALAATRWMAFGRRSMARATKSDGLTTSRWSKRRQAAAGCPTPSFPVRTVRRVTDAARCRRASVIFRRAVEQFSITSGVTKM